MSSFDFYFNNISAIPLLSPEEEIVYGAESFTGDELARNKLVESNLRFAVREAHKFSSSGIDFEDLVSEASSGLITAAQKFNPCEKVRFTTYAVWWIHHSLMKAVYDSASAMRIPLGNKNALNDVKSKTVNLESFGNDDSEHSFYNFIKDDSVLPPDEELLESELKSDVIFAIKKVLSNLEQQIIFMRFGFDDGKKKSLQFIGNKIGYSKERVRQLENLALKKLKPVFEQLGYAA